jgi:hypothetical protein
VLDSLAWLSLSHARWSCVTQSHHTLRLHRTSGLSHARQSSTTQSMQRIPLMSNCFGVFLIIFHNKIGLRSLNKSGSCLHVLHILKKLKNSASRRMCFEWHKWATRHEVVTTHRYFKSIVHNIAKFEKSTMTGDISLKSVLWHVPEKATMTLTKNPTLTCHWKGYDDGLHITKKATLTCHWKGYDDVN